MYFPVRPATQDTRLSNNRSRCVISIRQIERAALLGLTLFVAGMINQTFAQSSVFTYQGRLQDGGVAANGSYDFRFTLWDASSGGTQQPQPGPVTVNVSNVQVTAGNFSVQLDFGAAAFPGADRYLEMSVQLAGVGPFTTLSPRTKVTGTPYAIRSLSAANADTVTDGSITSAKLGSNLTLGGTTTGTFSGPLTGNASTATTAGNVSGVVAIANGGTGSNTQNFVDLTSTQASIGGA